MKKDNSKLKKFRVFCTKEHIMKSETLEDLREVLMEDWDAEEIIEEDLILIIKEQMKKLLLFL